MKEIKDLTGSWSESLENTLSVMQESQRAQEMCQQRYTDSFLCMCGVKKLERNGKCLSLPVIVLLCILLMLLRSPFYANSGLVL